MRNLLLLLVTLSLLLTSCASEPKNETQSKFVDGFLIEYNEAERTAAIVEFPEKAKSVVLSHTSCKLGVGSDPDNIEGIVYIRGLNGEYKPQTLYALYNRPINIHYYDTSVNKAQCVGTDIFFRKFFYR